MNHVTSSDSQLSDSTTQDYTGNTSEKMVQNRTLTPLNSTVNCNTVRASGRTGQNSSLRATDALKERASQNSTPTVSLTESMSQNNTEILATVDYTNNSDNRKSIPTTTLAEIFINSTEPTTEVVPTTQEGFNFSAILNTTSKNVSASASAHVKVFWLSKMTSSKSPAGTTTIVQWDTSSDPDGMATYLHLYSSTALPLISR